MRSCGEDQLVVLAVAIAAYLNGLHGAFLDDDPIAILENNDVACPRGLRGLFDNTNDLWSHDFWGTPLSSEDSHLSFRPLTVLSFRLQHAMHGFHKVAYHAVNVGLHAGVCVLLHRSLGSPVLPRRSQRLLATLLFALHTVHVEVVTNVVGRAELLSATFFFAALLLHGRSSTRIHTGEVISAATLTMLAGAAMLAGLAVLCKEVGLTALLVAGARECILGVWSWRCEATWAASKPFARLFRLLVLAAAACALLGIRLGVAGWRTPEFSPHDNSAAFCGTLACRALTYSYLYWKNLVLLLWPVGLAHDWSMTTIPNLESAADPRAGLALVPYALVLGILLAALRALVHRSPSFLSLSLSLALLVLPFLPAAHIFVTVGFTVAERVLYLPSAGACALLALAADRGRASNLWRPLRRLGPLALLATYAILTLRRNLDWRTNESLVGSGVSNQPTNAKLQYNLGHVHLQQARLAEAAHHLQLARRLLPSFHEAACVEAEVRRRQGHATQAEALLRDTLRAASAGVAAVRAPTPPAVASATAAAAGARVSEALARVRSRHEGQLHAQGVLFASRGLAGLLDDSGRAAEAWRALVPAIKLMPNDVDLVRQAVRAAQVSREPGAMLALRRLYQSDGLHADSTPPPPPTQQQPPQQPADLESSTSSSPVRTPTANDPARKTQRQWSNRLSGRAAQ